MNQIKQIILFVLVIVTCGSLFFLKKWYKAKNFTEQDIHLSLQSADKVYYTGSYPEDHWALQPLTFDDPKVVALAEFKHLQYACYLNPTDSRCLRCIVRLIDTKNMASTFNRPFITQEQIGLVLFAQLMMEAYANIAPAPQMAIAGNNSHTVDEKTNIMCLGKIEEPNILHAHIWVRGPKKQYIDGVEFNGPLSPQPFDLLGKIPNQPGNNAKIPWKPGQMEKVKLRLQQEIAKVKKSYEQFGLYITI